MGLSGKCILALNRTLGSSPSTSPGKVGRLGLPKQLDCSRCGTELRGTAYEVRLAADVVLRCLRCALLRWPMVRRSLLISLLVGTLLTAINQGNILVQGDFAASLAWKIPLTYLVPYCVATAGAVLSARRALV